MGFGVICLCKFLLYWHTTASICMCTSTWTCSAVQTPESHRTRRRQYFPTYIGPSRLNPKLGWIHLGSFHPFLHALESLSASMPPPSHSLNKLAFHLLPIKSPVQMNDESVVREQLYWLGRRSPEHCEPREGPPARPHLQQLLQSWVRLNLGQARFDCLYMCTIYCCVQAFRPKPV